MLVLERQVFGFGKLWYIIKGPGVATVQELDAVLPEIKDFASKNGVFMIKIEPEIRKTDEALVDLMKLGLLRTRNVQPNASTIYLDISPSMDDIMTGLNQKTRHAIRRAERDGATIKQVPATEENCREM